VFLQTTCQLSYIANSDVDLSSNDAQHLPQQNNDFQQPVELKANEPAASDIDSILSSPAPVVHDDSQGLTEAELLWTTDSVITDR